MLTCPRFSTPENSMVRICDIVQQAIVQHCLDLTAEAQLKQLLQMPYDSIDLQAYLRLRQAILLGQVKQASREWRDRQFEPTKAFTAERNRSHKEGARAIGRANSSPALVIPAFSQN